MINLSRIPFHPRLAAAMTTLAVALVGCSPAPDNAPAAEPTAGRQTDFVAAATQAVRNDGPAIKASRTYLPAESSVEGFASISPGQTFVIPASLPVVKGNAGNGTARLDITMRGRGFFPGLRDERFTCRYRGGSLKASPDDDLSRAQGRSYRLEFCHALTAQGSRDLRAGNAISNARLTLRVVSADPTQPQTVVEIGSGGAPTFLEPPISAEESIRIRDAFSWANTTPLAETNAEGFPALYYGIVYLEEEEQVQALDELWMHHDFLPLFAEEQARWAGQKGTFDNAGDGKGIFKFVVFPGKLYNILREAAQQNDLVFRVLQLRDIPAAARGADGSLSYSALRESGFLYRNGELPTDGVEAVAQPGLFSGLRKVVSAAATVVKAVVRTVAKGLGAIDRFANGSSRLTFVLDLRNTDPLFGLGTPMQRAWGPSMGQQVTIPDLRITVRQYTLGGVLPTLFSDRTNDQGIATMKVTKGKSASYCIALDNKAAQITNLLIEAALCDFGNIGSGQLESDFTHTLTLANNRLNTMAQASEGYAYLKGIAGYTPRKAKILVGPLAEAMGVVTKGAAIAPCLGISNMFYDQMVGTMAAAVGKVPVVGPAAAGVIAAAGTLYAVDMILPSDDGTNQGPRGVISHEYGHFALCNLMRDQGLRPYSEAMRDVLGDRLEFETKGTITPGMTINEGFADFFAGQIAGGINYGHNGWLAGSFVNGSGPMQWCLASSNSCLDRNFGSITASTEPATNAIARVVSILHDAFDGRSWRRGDLPQATPGNANVWDLDLTNGQLFIEMDNGRPVPGVPDDADEEIALNGPMLKNWTSRWFARGAAFNEDFVFGGLADAMKDQGYSWCQMCPLFASHEMGSGTGSAMFEACTRGPIAPWIGSPPPGGAASCCVASSTRVNVTKDANVFSRADQTGASFGQAPLLRAMTWTWNDQPGTIRGFFDFNLPPIPVGNEITSATLHLKAAYSGDPSWPGHSSHSNSNAFTIRKVLGAWQPSTLTWSNQPDSSPDFAAFALQSTSATQDYDVDVTALANDKLRTPNGQHGYVLQLGTEMQYAALSFGSSDHPDTTVRPTLTVSYRPITCR